jgi:hypothetical protein
MKSLIFAAAIGVVMATSAFAQTAEFYLVQDVKTKKCTVVDKKPVATQTTITVGDGKVYKTRTEAEGAIKTVKVCM